MEEIIVKGEKENKTIGWVTSIIVHLLFLLLFLVNFFNISTPLPGQTGVLVSFGTIEAGSEDDSPEAAMDEDALTQETEESQPAPAEKETEQSKSPEPTPKVVPPETKSNPRSETAKVVVEDQETKPQAPSAEEIEAAKKKAEAEAAAKKKQEEEAQIKKEYDERKKKFGSLLSGGKKKGNNPGDEGNPEGSPDQSALDDIAKGSGRVGGGLSNRGVIFEPTINENSQKTGTVVIKICVDKDGNVINPEFTQRGSSTTDITLINVAIKASKKYRFTPSEIEQQCGTVTVNFIVK